MNRLFINKLLAILIISFFVYSCGLPYCKKIPFSESDLLWIDHYTIGDTILFTSRESNAVDTMIIKDIDICNPTNTSIFDLKGCNWMESNNEFKAVANCVFIIIHNGQIFNNIFTLRKECCRKSALFSIGILGNYSTSQLSTADTIRTYIDELKNVGTLVVCDSVLYPGIHQTVIPVKELYWNRENGLTGYIIGNDSYILKK